MQQFMLRWRTYRGRKSTIGLLNVLAVAAKARGWRCVKLYEREQFPLPVPLLWIYASGAADDVGVVVSVRAVPGGGWAYYQAQRGRFGYLFPCGDVKAAIDVVDSILKHRMYPSTW